MADAAHCVRRRWGCFTVHSALNALFRAFMREKGGGASIVRSPHLAPPLFFGNCATVAFLHEITEIQFELPTKNKIKLNQAR